MSFQEFIEETQTEYDRTRGALQEIRVLIKQSTAEVSRLTQKNSQITTYVRQLKIDTAPREDIKNGYESLLNDQQRLFTMRGQLEKLQSDQQNLERLATLQGKLLENAGTGMLSGDGSAGEKPMADTSNVIRIIEIEESTRKSLVRKMHDGPASSLSNFILQAEICERLFDNDPERARTELDVLKSTAVNTFSKVKDFIFDLRPMMLDDLGIVPTLRSYALSLSKKSDIDATVTTTGIEQRLPGHLEVTIFSAVQQLASNARTHGQATEIQIQIDITPDQVTVVVEDNGKGFDTEAIFDSPSSKTLGLPTLQERLAMLNGELTVTSGMGQGTRAEFYIPNR